MDFVTADLLDTVGTSVVILLVAWAVISGKLVWHTQLEKAEARADRWEKVALEALALGAQAGIKAAEVTADVVSSLPDPARED